MACFLVPAAEAIVTTVATKIVKSQEKTDYTKIEAAESTISVHEAHHKPAFARKLRWLSNMLWGGAVLLCFEHLWHGEVVPYPPFLTAAYDPSDTATMLHEMSTVGVSMAILITAVWVGMVVVSGIIEKRPDVKEAKASQEV